MQPEGARVSSIKFSTTSDIKGGERTADDQGLEERILGRQRNDRVQQGSNMSTVEPVAE